MGAPKIRTALATAAGAALALTTPTAANAQDARMQSVAATPVTDTQVVLAREGGPTAVLVEASRLSSYAPGIAVSGYNRTGFNNVKAGVQMAAANGYPVSRLVLGPQDAEPNLTIIINGIRVTNPIDPNTITSDQLSRLIAELSDEYYPKRIASQGFAGPIASAQ